MLKSLAQFFSRLIQSKVVRKKIVLTLLILAVFRLIAHIPLTGINQALLSSLFKDSPVLSILNFFSGGTLANFSIMALGLNPYITSSIVLQLLTFIIPSLDALSKEGEYGQEKINQYTRFLTVPLAFGQGFAAYLFLRSQGLIGTLDFFGIITLISTMVAGTMVAVWLGDLITEYGISNGVSFLIFAGIVSRIPVSFQQTQGLITATNFPQIILFVVFSLIIVGLIVFITEAARRIPVKYARKLSKSVTPVSNTSYIPLHLNQAGVMPIIFAVSVALVPSLLGQALSGMPNPEAANLGRTILANFTPQSFAYNAFYFLLVVCFTYFYTASVAFNPEKISENLQKSGGFVPGVRPGKETTKYLGKLLNRVVIVGAVFLGAIATLPSLFQNIVNIPGLVLGGTGVLIVVSVAIEAGRQMNAQIAMGSYDKFLE